MSAVNLIFGTAPLASSPWRLVFGETDTSISAVIAIAGPNPVMDVQALVEPNTVMRTCSTPWRQGTYLPREVATPWSTRTPVHAYTDEAWRAAAPAEKIDTLPWAQNFIGPTGWGNMPWARGARTDGRTAFPWRDGLLMDAHGGDRWQQGIPVFKNDYDLPWRDGQLIARVVKSLIRQNHAYTAWATEPWGDGQPRFRNTREPWRDGRALHSWGGPWDNSGPPIPPEHVCYTPSGTLIFKAPATSSTTLIFVCEDGAATEPIVIPVQRVYIVENNVTLTRVSDGRVIACDSMTLNIDMTSWTWSFSAEVHSSQLQYIRRAAYGDPPVELEATINGQSVRVVADKFGQSRTHDGRTLKVTGRGISAVLGAPYAPELPFDQPAILDASQLADRILTFNGVSLGWTVDWQMADWSIPANTWSAQGTYADALNSLAASAGGYVQPDPVTQTLRFLKKYPELPWNWGAVTPDFILPSDIVELEEIEWADKPHYNMVYVVGQANGVKVAAKRFGTAGDLLAPMVTDPLITHVDAGRGRAESILAASATGAPVTLKTLILPEAGLILPGKFVRYVDGATTRIGLTRGISVTANHEESWQTLEVETNGD